MRDLPHVTAILRDAGIVDTAWFTDVGRDRGKALHLATELHDEGDLDEDSVDETIAGRLEGYRRWVTEVKPEILAIEEHVEYPGSYQGTLDRRVRIGGREGIVDIKAGGALPWHPIQLAGYARTFPQPMVRWSLYVGEGTYKFIEHKNRRQDDAVWLACVTLTAFRREHGI